MNGTNAQLRFVFCVGSLWLGMLLWSLRFEQPEFRAWEVVADPRTHFFAPNARLSMVELGDLSAWAWVRALQRPRQATFSTDRWGFRNPDGMVDARVVVIGDSFVGGSGQSDDETVTARMTQALGEPVYNFALTAGRVPAHYLASERFIRHPPQVVIYAPSQRSLRPISITLPATEAAEGLWKRGASVLREKNDRIELSNGLTRSARYAYNGLSYALLGRDDERQLPDGTRALSLSLVEQHLTEPLSQRKPVQLMASLRAFAALLESRGSRFVFAPIPDHGNVYPELYPEQDRTALVEPSLIDLVTAQSQQAGLTVVDLPQAFRSQKYPYLYRVDDSHWNAHATALTANALSAAVRSIRAQPRDAEPPPAEPPPEDRPR